MKLLWKNIIHRRDEELSVSTLGLYNEPILFDGKVIFFYDGHDPKSKARPYIDDYIFAAAYDMKTGEKKDFHSFKLPTNEKRLALIDYWEITKLKDRIQINTGKYAEKTYSYLTLENVKNEADAGKTDDGDICFFDENVKTETSVGKTEDGKCEWIKRVKDNNYYTKIIDYTEKGFEVVSDAPDGEKKVHNEAKIYKFDGYEVYIPKNFTRKLECKRTDTGEVVWIFKFPAHLYTELKEKDGIVYFGTAGNGGHFYGLNLKDGSKVLDINTHGTVRFSMYKNDIYLSSEFGNLLVYDTSTKAIREFEFDEWWWHIHGDVKLIIENDKLYTIAYEQEGRTYERYPNIYAICIDLAD
jgi:hypothetical protein